MVSDICDSFLDSANWPDAEEREHLARIFGWDGDVVVGSDSHATHALRKPAETVERKAPSSG